MNFRRYQTLWVLIPVLAIVVYHELAQSRETPERVPWQTDLPAARDQAAKAGKLVFIDFTADWCGPCRSLKQTLWNDSEVAAAIAARFVPVRIDVDRQGEIANQFVREGIPTFVILAPDGTGKKYSVGAVSKSEFLKWINSDSQGPTAMSSAN